MSFTVLGRQDRYCKLVCNYNSYGGYTAEWANTDQCGTGLAHFVAIVGAAVVGQIIW
jgi:hypothetical protein